jgi:limonene-1,2-epoxide hydrolase
MDRRMERDGSPDTRCSLHAGRVIEVRGGRISRNLDYYDAATIMKQVWRLPAS